MKLTSKQRGKCIPKQHQQQKTEEGIERSEKYSSGEKKCEQNLLGVA